MMKNHPHPGELLREDVLLPLGIQVTDAGVSTTRFWMTLQANYELSQAEQRKQPAVQRIQFAA